MSGCGHEVYDEGTCGPCVAALRDALAKAREKVGHAGWVGGMVLGICEGAPGWEAVKEYPAGPDVEAWGAPAIIAAKALMRRALAAERARDEARAALRECQQQDGDDGLPCWCCIPSMIPYRGHDTGCEAARRALDDGGKP